MCTTCTSVKNVPRASQRKTPKEEETPESPAGECVEKQWQSQTPGEYPRKTSEQTKVKKGPLCFDPQEVILRNIFNFIDYRLHSVATAGRSDKTGPPLPILGMNYRSILSLPIEEMSVFTVRFWVRMCSQQCSKG